MQYYNKIIRRQIWNEPAIIDLVEKELGTKIRDPLSVEKELGNQTYPTRYDTDPWARHMLKGLNCTRAAAL
jgi:hypothetical protein